MIDLTAILYTQRSIPRGDELLSHVSDLTKCLRDVSYRRRGLTPAPFTPQDQAKFAIGLGYEMEVASTLRAAGHDVQTDVEVGGFGLDIGHPDIILDRELLIETKTTTAGAMYPKSDKQRAGEPREVSAHHAIQAASYALALELPQAVVYVAHFGGYEVVEVQHAIRPEDYREHIEMLAREVVALTGPEMPIPGPEPKPKYVTPYDQCAYCDWHICERNPHHTEIPL